MLELNFSPAHTTDEVDEAFRLALRIFSRNSAPANYPDLKAALWRDDPGFKPTNLLLARDGSKRLVGLVRIVPRSIFRLDQKFSVAGISSVCIAPEFRGHGFSAPLMEHALEQSHARGFDLALLFARRTADHYYTRFGFWGISSYNKAVISFPDSASGSQRAIEFIPANQQHADLYARAHADCYRDSFGHIERTARHWAFLLKNATLSDEPKWLTITDAKVPIGYMVTSREIVLEIAWLGSLPARDLVAAASKKIPDPTGARRISAELPPNHRLLAHLENLDITMSFRECSYGGHMVKILNTPRACDLLAARITGRFSRLGVREHAEEIHGISVRFGDASCRVVLPEHEGHTPSYQQTCRLLGASALSMTHWEVDPSLPFNISNPDQL